MATLVAGVIAQGADAVTMRLQFEANPIVLGLGSQAYLAKIALILGVAALSWALPRLPTPSLLRLRALASRSLSWVLLLVGAIGAASNLLARS